MPSMLPAGQKVTVNIPQSAVKNNAGKDLASQYQFSFTTANTLDYQNGTD
jgi:hypothetical protein